MINSSSIGEATSPISDHLFTGSYRPSYLPYTTLRFKSRLIETPLGFGYKTGWDSWSLNMSLFLLLARETYTDNHVLRGITLTEKQFGIGFATELFLKRRLSSNIWAGIRFYRKSLFLETEYLRKNTKMDFAITGISTDYTDIIGELGLTKPISNRGVKEYRIEFHVEKKFNR